jgi:hypothetical protein
MRKTTSEARSEAARQNGSKSKGPISEAGREASSKNATKHGLTAQQSKLLPGDDPEAFEAYVHTQMDRFEPASHAEIQLVRDFATAGWRLRAANNHQAGIIEIEMFFNEDECIRKFGKQSLDTDIHVGWAVIHLAMRLGNPLSVASRYIGTFQRQYVTLLKELTAIQEARRKAELRNEPKKSIKCLINQQYAENLHPHQDAQTTPVPPVEPPLTPSEPQFSQS